MKNFLAVCLIVSGSLIGCAQQDENKFKEKARAEENAKTQADLEATNARAKQMEQDLQKRFRFYKGVSHNYSGQFKIGNNGYQLKLRFVPTLFVIETERVRTLEEVQSDLNNLHLNAQLSIWDLAGGLAAGGCVYENVRPDIVTGRIQLASNECPQMLTVELTLPNTESFARETVASALASDLLVGNLAVVDLLHVDVNSKLNPNGYAVVLERIK